MYYLEQMGSLFLCVGGLVTVCGWVGHCLWLFYSSGRLVFCCSSLPLPKQRKKGKKEISILKNVDHRLGLSTVSTGCCEQPNVCEGGSPTVGREFQDDG